MRYRPCFHYIPMLKLKWNTSQSLVVWFIIYIVVIRVNFPKIEDGVIIISYWSLLTMPWSIRRGYSIRISSTVLGSSFLIQRCLCFEVVNIFPCTSSVGPMWSFNQRTASVISADTSGVSESASCCSGSVFCSGSGCVSGAAFGVSVNRSTIVIS